MPYQVVEDFETALAEYTGARFAVTVTSCTAALHISLLYDKQLHPHDKTVIIPSRTYNSVPMAAKSAGFDIEFEDYNWARSGYYLIHPTKVIDSARLFTSNMYVKHSRMCCSFHWTKTLAVGTGGCILLDDEDAYEWLKKARFDGRTQGVPPSEDNFDMIGFHYVMAPRDAAEGLSRLSVLPKHNDPLPNDPYADLSQFEVFK